MPRGLFKHSSKTQRIQLLPKHSSLLEALASNSVEKAVTTVMIVPSLALFLRYPLHWYSSLVGVPFFGSAPKAFSERIALAIP